jgi:hypothetical protein
MPHFVFWNSNLDQTISQFRLEYRAQQSLLSAAVVVVVVAIGLAVVVPVVSFMELPIP